MTTACRTDHERMLREMVAKSKHDVVCVAGSPGSDAASEVLQEEQGKDKERVFELTFVDLAGQEVSNSDHDITQLCSEYAVSDPEANSFLIRIPAFPIDFQCPSIE